MVKRILGAIHRQIGELHEAAYVLAIFAFAAQLLSLVRDRLFAHIFGASTTLDIYYAAFRIPDLVFISLGSLVSAFVLIPFLTRQLSESTEKAHIFIKDITSAFFYVLVGVSVVLVIVVPQLVRLVYPGFSGTDFETLVMLTRLLLLSPIILGLSNITATIVQVRERFVLYALTPVVYNTGIIIGILFLYPSFGILGLGIGVLIGALFHVGVQIPSLLREGLLPHLGWPSDWKRVWSIVSVSLPRTLALAANQGALLVLVALAALMPEGSISIFNLSLNLQGAPLGIIGVSYSVAAFPTLARLFSNGNREEFLKHMSDAIRHVLFWSFPATVLFIVLRAQIVRTVLGSGAFSWDDTRLTAAALALFVVSLSAQGLMLLFVRGYYAAGKTARPLIVNLASALITIGVAILMGNVMAGVPMIRYFMEALFRVADVPGTEVLALPLGYSIGFLVNAGIFWFLFRHDFGGHIPKGLYTTMWQNFSASIIAGAVAYGFLGVFAGIFELSTTLGIFLQGLFSGIIGILAWTLVLTVLKNSEWHEMRLALSHRFWREKPIGSEPAEL